MTAWGAILAEMESYQCHTASERLYCKRLRLILPEIMAQCNPDYTTRELKGNTALHYACSLSHVGLVQWLVNHGAEGVLFSMRYGYICCILC